MSDPTHRTYLLIGTVTKDLLEDGGYSAGGTIVYAGAVVKALGWQPAIITAAGPDFSSPAYLRDADWHILPSEATTTFRNEYTPQGRRQTVGPIARSMGPTDIPPKLSQSILVHLCPLAQDVDPNVTDLFKDSFIGATPQGWLREWDPQGRVSHGTWPEATRILPRLQAAIISIEDIDGNWTLAETWANSVSILIVTEGQLGCSIFHDGEKITVPPRPSRPIDPTGAGDVFSAAFFIRFYETGQLWQSAYFANVTASMALEQAGPGGVPNRNEIERYIAQNPASPPSEA